MTRQTRRSRKPAAPGDIGCQLDDARRAAGLTQKDLAARLGVSQAQVAHLEQRAYGAYRLRSLRRYIGARRRVLLAIAVRHGDTLVDPMPYLVAAPG